MTATFTHTGRRERVGSINLGKLFGHDIPKAGRVHALNAPPRGAYTAYVALCGERVHVARTFTEWGDPIPAERRTVQPGADPAKVTCARCRKMLKA
jgi:hypothetical protein